MSFVSFGKTRHRSVLVAAIVALGALALLLAITGGELYSQDEPVTEIAADSYQFVGRIDQNGPEFTAYGYVYNMDGVAPTDLFSDGDPINSSEATAHFTYYASADLTSRGVITDATRAIFALDSVGEIVFYYHETPSASFEDPGSFMQGTAVTTATARLQDILTVQAPNRGLANGNGEFSVLSADAFTFDGNTVRLGRPGKSYRVSTLGDAVRTDPNIPQSSVLLAGDAIHIPFWEQFLPVTIE